MQMFSFQIDECEPLQNGNFIERMLFEIEKNSDDSSSSFHPRDGKAHLMGQMQDIFVAGESNQKLRYQANPMKGCNT